MLNRRRNTQFWFRNNINILQLVVMCTYAISDFKKHGMTYDPVYIYSCDISILQTSRIICMYLVFN